MGNYKIQSGTLFEDFETVGDFTVGGSGGPTLTADTTNFKTGTQSLKLTTGSGLSCTATKTISLDASRSGVWGFWAYVYDITQLGSIKLELSSDSSFTDRYVRTITGAYFHNGWNFISLDRSSNSSNNNWGTSGSPSWSNTQIRIRLTVTANASSTAIVSFDSIYYGIWGRPKIVLMFDDAWSSTYTEAYQYLRKYGLKGSVPVNTDLVGDGTHCTLDQLIEMYNYGFDMLNHTTDHTNLSTLSTEAEVLAKITPAQEYLKNNGLTRNDGWKHLVYPSGGYSDTVFSAMKTSGCLTGCSIISRVENQIYGLDNSFLISRRTLGGDTLTSAAAQAYIDTAISNGGTYLLYFHKIVSTTEANTNEWLDTKFESFIDYLAQKSVSGIIDVVTFSEWYIGLTNSRKLA